ncbi:MAG: hypothetical protein WC415_03635 [Patescibacteria group bacterium]|jgi:cell shape-determining protein MreD
MMVKFFWYLLLFSLLAVWQISFAGSLPWYLREINFFIIFLVFFLEFSHDNLFWWFLFAGFIFDFYYAAPFGFFMIFLPAVFLFAKFLSLNFFTNRSLYSCWGLTFFAVIFYYFVFYGAFYAIKFSVGEPLFILEKKFWLSLLLAIILNLSVSSLVFYFFGALSDRLKPFFIVKGNK